MIAPARRFSCLSMPSCLILEQSNAVGTSGSIEDWVVTLYLKGPAGALVPAVAPRPNGFDVARSSSETPDRARNPRTFWPTNSNEWARMGFATLKGCCLD